MSNASDKPNAFQIIAIWTCDTLIRFIHFLDRTLGESPDGPLHGYGDSDDHHLRNRP